MAQYNGYVVVPHGSYQEWRNATLGNGYNVDGYAGNQCWDFCALLWWQYGLDLRTVPNPPGRAKDCWLVSRAYNSQPPFISIYNKEEIKRGDVIVFGYGTNGHIGFADADYSGNLIPILGQNQGQGSAAPSNVVNWYLNTFLGAFRNTDWDVTPPESPTPTPTEGEKKKEFPWPVAWHHWQNFKRK